MGKPAMIAFFTVFLRLFARQNALPPVSYAAYHAAYGTGEASVTPYEAAYITDEPSSASPERVAAALQGANRTKGDSFINHQSGLPIR